MNTLPASGTWYLFDYGKVISTEPLAEDWDALGEAAGLDLRSPSSSYWAARLEYDGGGLSPAEYWASVLGRPVGGDDLDRLEELDARLWSRLNPRTLEVLDFMAGQGAHLALLSNMPEGMSHRYESEAAWPGFFVARYFSGRLRMVKPEPQVYRHVLKGLGAAPEDVVFIDDNRANIEAAEALGMRVVLLREDTDLRQELALLGEPA
ncbi:HAD family phosphatase [Arthrobacter koreensis]|uniref:HAD family phosphatase n=1 Tax=Arthrobacter koreensis TaxID=199136 RepID=A0ABY6FVL1_9MICC|nr:HAD family phosphatase [Arthrobacter koreensis]UYB37246.1 HAD family phosphatase [Arthrobacter koreensis]